VADEHRTRCNAHIITDVDLLRVCLVDNNRAVNENVLTQFNASQPVDQRSQLTRDRVRKRGQQVIRDKKVVEQAQPAERHFPIAFVDGNL
jgi:hypothetical protein